MSFRAQTEEFRFLEIFKASALWADAFYKSKCPSVRLSVCPCVRLCVCSLLRYLYSVYNRIYNGKNLQKPKIFIFDSKIHLYELICHPYTEEDQTKPVCFMKKISLIKKNQINLRFMIFDITMELHCNGKILKFQINLIFKALALWAGAFYKSKCPSVCPSVCLSVCLFNF